jgi:peptidoglycan/xylan/chitin deacetylase (PgdA/CDA1 family)
VRDFLQQHGYRVAQVSMDFEDYLWNEPYARCEARHDDASVKWLEKTYLDTAGQYIGVYRQISQTLYGRDIPYILLMHLGAFDARMLPQLIELFRQRGFTFTTLPRAMEDPVYREDPDMALKYGGAFTEQMMAARHLKVAPNTKPYKELQAVCR